MGQTDSNLLTETISETFLNLNLEVRSKAQQVQEINSLTKEELIKYIEELNDLSRNCLISNGRQMVFTIQKDSDTGFLWKATVRISCIKFDPVSKRIDHMTFMTLRQFMQLFRTFQTHLETMISTTNRSTIQDRLLEEACGNSSSSSSDTQESFTEECCICLDRKPELILPCLHLFCAQCIEQWNKSNKTCPICSEKLDSTEDSWVISEVPEADEISHEIQTSLLNLSDDRHA